MEKGIIFLVGMPGCGKTYNGQLLANKLGLTFVDLDLYIELVSHQSIQQIFDVKGEKYFRKIETECLKEICMATNIVVACGGGTPCFNGNMDLIKTHGTSVFIDKEVSVLAKNIIKGEERPMFKGLKKSELVAKLNELAILRHPFYKKSNKIAENIDDIYSFLSADNQ